jgi:hypothetical protein
MQGGIEVTVRILFTTCIFLLLSAPLQADDWYDYWNSGGELWAEADYSGSASTGDEWIVTSVQAYEITNSNFLLTFFAFPCASLTGEPVEWGLWVMAQAGPPPGPPSSAHYSGTFIPPLVEGSGPPPFTYVTFEGPYAAAWSYEYLIFGYKNPGFAGLTDFNGVESWRWSGSEWASDSSSGQTAVLQVMGMDVIIPTDPSSWSRIKNLY